MNQSSALDRFFASHAVGEVVRGEPLARHTSYRVGGPADYFVVPEHTEGLKELLGFCGQQGVAVFLLGDGANVLVSDAGFRGVVISMSGGFGYVERLEGNRVRAGAGVPVRRLVRFCEERGLGGLEGLAGIPGTVGGALVMNAGAAHGEIGDRVHSVAALDSDFVERRFSREEIGFSYRAAPLLRGTVVLECVFELEEASREELGRVRRELLARRAQRQPLKYPSCGSVFKRPPGRYAGALVEQAGLKGMRIGGAMISEKHAGFIVNLGDATARDIVALIRLAQVRVREKFGVELEPEVRFLGFEQSPVSGGEGR